MPDCLNNVKYIIPHKRDKYNNICKKKYFNKNNHLVVIIGNKEYVYPPKAGVIIMDKQKDKILIVKNKTAESSFKWGLPKGHLEENESREDCAAREFKEETGLNIYIARDDPRIRINNSIYYIYYTNIQNKKIIPEDNTEIIAAKFCYINRIKTLDINRELAVAIKNKFTKIKNIAKYIILT